MKFKHWLLTILFFSISNITHASTHCIQYIEKNTHGNLLDLSSCDLHPDDLSVVETYLEAHPAITALDISDNYRVFSENNATVFLANVTLKEINANSTMSYANGDYTVRLLLTIPTLKKLSIENDQLTNQALTWLTSSGLGLQALDIADNKGITEPGLFAFLRTANLQTLNIDHLPLSTRVIFSLAIMPNLTDMEFGDHAMKNIDDGLLKALVYKKTVTNFGMHGINVSTAQLETIAKNKHITHLSITSSNIDHENCAVIVKNPSLTYLNLSANYNIGDGCVKQFSTLKSLNTLILDGFSNINGDDFSYFKNHKNIHTLVLNANGMRNIDAIADIQSLNSLTLRNAPVDDVFFKKLFSNTQLNALVVDNSYAGNVPMEGLAVLSQATHIKKLTLSDSYYITNDIIANFAKNPHFEMLDFSMNGLKENVLAMFNHSTLTKLVLYRNNFNPYGDVANHFLAESQIANIEFVEPVYRSIEK